MRGMRCGIGDEKLQKREQGLPEERPVVVEPRASGDKVREKLVYEGDTGDVERKIKAAAKVVIYGINHNIENRGSWWARGRVGRKQRLTLAAEADCKSCSRLADNLAQSRIFDHQTQNGQVKKPVESRP